MADPTFTRAQATSILRRASELQSAHSPATDTLTATELEQIAAEAGIDIRFVHEAMHARDAQATMTGPRSLFHDEFLMAGQHSDDALQEALVAVRAAVGQPGKVSHDAAANSWRWSDDYSTEICLSRTSNGIWVQSTVDLRLDKPIYFLWLPLLGVLAGPLAAIPLTALLPGAWDVVAVLGGAATGASAGFVLARRLWMKKARQVRASLAELRTRLLGLTASRTSES